jgi:hypothetical protein
MINPHFFEPLFFIGFVPYLHSYIRPLKYFIFHQRILNVYASQNIAGIALGLGQTDAILSRFLNDISGKKV